MKRKATKLLIGLLVWLLVMAVGAAAVMSAQIGVITGENDVTNMVINVIVPTDLSFTLDPMEIDSIAGSQIAYANYFFINKTSSPVRVSLDFTVILGDGVDIVDNPDLLAKDDDNVKDKTLYFAVLGADSINPGDLSFERVSVHNAMGSYTSLRDTLVPFRSSDHRASIEFILGGATESVSGVSGVDTLAADNKGIAAFQFYGELNTYAPWAPGDISVTCAYTITPMRAATYENYIKSNYFTVGGWGTQLRTGYNGN